MNKDDARWFLSGAVLIVSFAGITLLSHFFVFGQGHESRPILLFLILIAFACGAYFFAVERLFGSHVRNIRWIILIAILCRGMLLLSEPIQETDPNRYYWDGQQILHGNNPYLYSPREASLRRDRYRLNGESGAQEVFEKINHPEIPTIYPPLAEALFAAAQFVSPWQSWGWRGLIFICEMFNLALLASILRKTQIPNTWVVVYAWSPLVIKEFSNSLHLDVFAVFFILVMMWALTRRRWVLGFAALSAATLIKWFALSLLPLLAYWVWKEKRSRCVQGLFLYIGLCVLSFLPFKDAGSRIFEGLAVFASGWRVNDGIYGIILAMVTALPLIGRESAELVSRLISASLLGGVVLGCLYWLKDRNDVKELFRSFLVVTAALFFLAPTGNPWYYTWCLPFVVYWPLRSLIIFSGLVFLYYLDFHFSYRYRGDVFVWVRAAEYGIFYFILLGELWLKRRASQLSYPSTTNGPSSAKRSHM